MFMVSVDQRLLIDRQESEWKRKSGIRYWSHSGGNNGRSVAAGGFWQVHPQAANTLVRAVMQGLLPRK
ncbi:RNA methyltransferase, partial [Streptomyces cyaneofuscatus]